MRLPRERLRAVQARLLERAQQPVPNGWIAVVVGGAQVGVASPEVVRFLSCPPTSPRASHDSARARGSRPHPRPSPADAGEGFLPSPESAGEGGAKRRVRALGAVSTLGAGEPGGFTLLADALVLSDAGADVAARTALLHHAALRLRDAGLLRGWRDEPLDVRPTPDAPPLAAIERAACRTLGITTLAVHLNAFTPNGEIVIAQRAAHKQIDPDLWDNLVGGMVPAGESELDALRREAQEEAGLDIAAWPLERGGRIHVTRVVPEGYQSEIVQVFDTVLPAGTAPRNQDGEVQRFATLTPAATVAAIERGEFTLEAALVLLDALLRRD